MERWFRVQHLDVDRLLAHWQWLCPGPKRLVARSAFGDLFLETDSGEILRLDVSIGKLERIAESEARFRELVDDPEKLDQWFAETDETSFAAKGLVPTESQCIGFSPPLVFAEKPHEPYLVDIHEHVSFLGDLNEQIANVPDGGKIELIVGERPPATGH
jgi:hypothetical protein